MATAPSFTRQSTVQSYKHTISSLFSLKFTCVCKWLALSYSIPYLTVHLVGRYHPRRGRNVPPPTTSPAQEMKTGPESTNSSSREWNCSQVISRATTSLNPLPVAKGRSVPPLTLTTKVPVPQRKPAVNFLRHPMTLAWGRLVRDLRKYLLSSMYFSCIICHCYITQYFLDKLVISSKLPSHNDMNRWYDQILFITLTKSRGLGAKRR
jgi:hypothetical protein